MAITAKITFVYLTIISFFLTLFGQPGYPTSKTVDMNKFSLVWSDEFDGDSVDYTKWNAGWWGNEETMVRKGGWWNGKLATVEDGCLHIATKYYENGINNDGNAGWYSTQLTTRYSYEQKYGYFETRCILPKGVGLWSAFWMICEGTFDVGEDGTDGSEIDIFESAYYPSDVVSSAIHYDGYESAHKTKVTNKTHVYSNNPYEEFNTYGVEWNESGYTFYINGHKCGSSTFGGVSKVPEYLLLSVEVGGSDGVPGESWAGKSIETNDFAPTDFVVDYVRAYQYNFR